MFCVRSSLLFFSGWEIAQLCRIIHTLLFLLSTTGVNDSVFQHVTCSFPLVVPGLSHVFLQRAAAASSWLFERT